jgi:hypothetical protein
MMLGAIESLMSAVVYRMMEINDNPTELGGGDRNIFTAIRRTACDRCHCVERLPTSGPARGPGGGMVHVLDAGGDPAVCKRHGRFIPIAVLAAILFVVSYNTGGGRFQNFGTHAPEAEPGWSHLLTVLQI